MKKKQTKKVKKANEYPWYFVIDAEGGEVIRCNTQDEAINELIDMYEATSPSDGLTPLDVFQESIADGMLIVIKGIDLPIQITEAQATIKLGNMK